MNILIVDDSDDKIAEIQSELTNQLKPETIFIQQAKSFLSAIRKLETSSFDLLILDLMLPIRDGDIPDSSGGEKVLSEVMDGARCKKPSHIICLTAHADIARNLKQEASRRLVHLILYDEIDPSWRNSLTIKARFILERINEIEHLPKDYAIDIAIITSYPTVELQEVIRLPGDFRAEYNRADNLHYYSAKWTNSMERNLTVVACSAPAMGMTSACVTACKVINRWRPRFLVMCGIAAGTKRTEMPGDILVAEAVFDYGSGKIVEIEEDKRILIPSHTQLRLCTELFSCLQRWEREQIQMDNIRKAWHDNKRESPRLHLGLIASGSAVVQSEELVKDILQQHRKVVGLDMESFAIFEAARSFTPPLPNVLVAKSVSDFADKRKGDDFQQYAAFTSARFVFELFTNASELFS